MLGPQQSDDFPDIYPDDESEYPDDQSERAEEPVWFEGPLIGLEITEIDLSSSPRPPLLTRLHEGVSFEARIVRDRTTDLVMEFHDSSAISLGPGESHTVAVRSDRELILAINEIVSAHDCPLVVFDAARALRPFLRRVRRLQLESVVSERQIIDPALCADMAGVATYRRTTKEGIAAALNLPTHGSESEMTGAARRLGARFPIVGGQTAKELMEQEALWARGLPEPVDWPFEKPAPALGDSWWGGLYWPERLYRIAATVVLILLWPLLAAILNHHFPTGQWFVHAAIAGAVWHAYEKFGPPSGLKADSRTRRRHSEGLLEEWRRKRWGILGPPSRKQRLVEIPYLLLAAGKYLALVWVVFVGSIVTLFGFVLVAAAVVALFSLYERLLGYA